MCNRKCRNKTSPFGSPANFWHHDNDTASTSAKSVSNATLQCQLYLLVDNKSLACLYNKHSRRIGPTFVLPTVHRFLLIVWPCKYRCTSSYKYMQTTFFVVSVPLDGIGYAWTMIDAFTESTSSSEWNRSSLRTVDKRWIPNGMTNLHAA